MNQTSYVVLESKLPLEEIRRRFPITDRMINRQSRMRKFEEGDCKGVIPNRQCESSNNYQSTFFQTETNTMQNSNNNKSSVFNQRDNSKRTQCNQLRSHDSFNQKEQHNPFIMTNQNLPNDTSRLMNCQSNQNYEADQQCFTSSFGNKTQYSPHKDNKEQLPIRISPTLALRASPERKYVDERDNYCTGMESKDYIQQSNTMGYERGTHCDMNAQFISFLKAIIEIENQIEQTKVDLAHQCDFNIDDAYNFFENHNKEMLAEMDIKAGLNKLLMHPTNEELRLLITAYDLSNKGGLDFIDFFDMLVPFNKRFRDMVEQRNPRSASPSSTDVFSSMTNNILVALLRLLISSEVQLNSLKKQLYYQNGLNVRKLFTQLDQFNYGYITSNDLGDYLRNFNLCVDNQDIVLLYIRLDKNRDGQVVYDELKALVTPIMV